MSLKKHKDTGVTKFFANEPVFLNHKSKIVQGTVRFDSQGYLDETLVIEIGSGTYAIPWQDLYSTRDNAITHTLIKSQAILSSKRSQWVSLKTDINKLEAFIKELTNEQGILPHTPKDLMP